MEMGQIRYVLSAAHHLNFTRAAEECGVTQPALTKGIKALEAELGAPLFNREGRRISLSGFGRSMLPHFRSIAEEAEATRALADNFRLLAQVPVKLGVQNTIGHLRLARFLAEFERRHEGIELAVSEAPRGELERQLDSGELDLAIFTRMDDGDDRFRLTPLYEERYVVVFPPGHRMAAANAVMLGELSGQPYVDRLACELREMVMGVCKSRDIDLYARFRSEREDWVQAMVLAGIGFAFMPEYSVTLPGLVQRPLIEPEVSRNVVAASVPGRQHSPAAAALMRAAQGFRWPG
ncbi:LysR family transcriptional regulator [Silicimonas sp. MF1-12-2]|uniref:LysR family transcriptional regulator n=1 Tax=Silicimonas sp. MF1-12-2 TaxID=3384793 RepID=UPI0039B5A1C2